MLPSRWIFSPFGQPSYWAARSHSPFLLILKIRPKGISTHHKLPWRSKDGPSRKESTGAPCRLGSDQAVRRFLRRLAGREVKRWTSIFLMGWKGLINGMPSPGEVLTCTYYREVPPNEKDPARPALPRFRRNHVRPG